MGRVRASRALAATAGPHHRSLSPPAAIPTAWRGWSASGLARRSAQTFVVENRVGANGAIATRRRWPVRAGDGYTLLWAATPPLTINPALTKVNYDPIKDFAPISAVAINAFGLVVNKDFPPKTVAEFIAYVRAQPNKLGLLPKAAPAA